MELHDSKEQTANKSNSLISNSSRNELPIIQQGENLLVNARTLWLALKSGYQFQDWMRIRIADFGFIEGQDYFSEKTEKSTPGRKAKNYHLTLDMAKELAMLERSETGRFFRRYFIQREKELVALKKQTLITSPTALFQGLKPIMINNRKLFPYTEILERLGYRRLAGGARKKTYPQHFAKIGDHNYVTEEFARHMAISKAVYDNRKVMRDMAPVLALDFGDTSKLLNK